MAAPKNLSKKASLNALASIIDYGARVVVEFIITPLLVAGLGNYLYGLWRILWRLNGYMDAAGGRSAQALKWIVAQDQSSANYDEKRRYIGATVVVWFLFLPLLLMLGSLLIWLAPVFLKVPKEFLWITQLTIGLLALNVILMGLADIPRAVLQGENLGYKRIGLSTFLVLAGGGLTALAIHFNLGLTGVASATVVATLLTGLMFLLVVGKHVSWFGIAKPSRKTIRWLSGLSGWFVVWKVVSQLMLAGDVLILGIFDSVVLVSVYSLTKYVPETLIRLVGTVVFNISPGLGGIIGAGNLDKASAVRNEIMAFTWLLLTVSGSVILLWNPLFVQLWVGKAYFAGLIPTLLIIVWVAQVALIRNDANIIDLTLDIRSKVLVGILSEILALCLAALLVGHYKMGIIGVSAGCIAGHFIISLVYPWLVSRFLGISFYSQLKSTLRPLLSTAFLFMLMIGASHYQGAFIHIYKPDTWSELVVGAAATSAVVLVLAFYSGLARNQRANLLNRIRLVTKRSRPDPDD